MKKDICILLVILCTGCITTKFKDSYTTPDGKVGLTEYKSTSSAWPFGKVDSTVHTMATKFGNSSVNIGQNANGMDNTAQATFLQAVIEAALKVMATAAKSSS